MKKITIGDKPFRLIENTKDISALRNLEFETYKLKLHFHGADTEDVLQTLEKYEKAFDQNKMAECLIYLSDLRRGIEQINKRLNPQHYMFALLVLEEGEEQTDETTLDTSYLQEKMDRLYQLGVTEDFIEETVLNFTLASLGSSGRGLSKTLVKQV